MVQLMSSEWCRYCGHPTYEMCDWCAFIENKTMPICGRHTYTRMPWAGELHNLCQRHAQQLHEMRKAWIADHGYTPRHDEWRDTQAYEYEPYLAPAPAEGAE